MRGCLKTKQGHAETASSASTPLAAGGTHVPPVSLYVFSSTRLEVPSSGLKYLQRWSWLPEQTVTKHGSSTTGRMCSTRVTSSWKPLSSTPGRPNLCGEVAHNHITAH